MPLSARRSFWSDFLPSLLLIGLAVAVSLPLILPLTSLVLKDDFLTFGTRFSGGGFGGSGSQ